MESIPKTPKSLKRLRREVHRIRRVYDATMYSYQQTSQYLRSQLSSKNLIGSTPIAITVGDSERTLARSPHELLSRLIHTYPEVLRESLFVRLVSQFEVFLVDTVLEISNRSMEPFKQQDKILEYHQAELLSYKSIDDVFFDIVLNECRQLSSQGFIYARKYYERRFGIRLENSGIPIEDIEEIHERRHMFVHRGGQIDTKYQRRFAKTLNVGDQLEITEDYLLSAIDKIITVAEYVTHCVKTNWPVPHLDFSQRLDKETLARGTYNLTYWFKAQFPDQFSMKSHISPASAFLADGERHQLSEILISITFRSETEVEWVVDGPKRIVGPYVGIQKILSNRGKFLSFESKPIFDHINIVVSKSEQENDTSPALRRQRTPNTPNNDAPSFDNE